MAPTIPQRAAADSSTPPSTSSTTHRIAKSRSERASSSRSCMTRQRSKMLAEESSNGVLQDMVDEAQMVAGGSESPSGSFTGKLKGKGKAAVTQIEEDEQMMAAIASPPEPQATVCLIQDKDEKPFRIMDLPAEIRLEIYRACVTRPCNLLLSKRERPVVVESPECDSDDRIILESTDSDDESMLLGPVTRRPRLSRPQASNGTQAPHPASRRPSLAGGFRGLASRGARPLRITSSRSAPLSSTNSNANTGAGSNGVYRPPGARPARRAADSRSRHIVLPEPPRPQSQDPLIVNILRTTKQIYKEARSVLYSENLFTLDLNTAMSTLACLHQRSRRQIKHVEIEIPTYNEILERFQETVRLSLRYCSGLKEFIIHMPFTLPGADGSGTTGNTTVYANGFDILRWLPQECNINLRGNVCTEIETVVNKHQHLAKHLDKVRYSGLQRSPWHEQEKWAAELREFEQQEKARKKTQAGPAEAEK